MIKIKLSNGDEYEVLPMTAVYPSYSSTVRSHIEIHMDKSSMSDTEFIALFSNQELTKTIQIINTESNSTITYERYNEPISIGIGRYDSVNVATGEVVTEYHLIANLEQLTYQEADIKAMKELIAKMSQ